MAMNSRYGIRGKDAQRRDAGFTLIELLVVVIIIGILAAIAIPIYVGVTRSAHKADANSWVTNASQLIYSYSVKNGAFPATPADAGVPTPSSDLATQYFKNSDQFCVSAYWTGAPSGGAFGPTDDTWKTVFAPSADRTSLVPVNPASFCVNTAG